MADDPESNVEPPFDFLGVEEVTSSCILASHKREPEIKFSAGIYHITFETGLATDEKIVYSTTYKQYLTLETVISRLTDPKPREVDCVTPEKSTLRVWDANGTEGVPSPHITRYRGQYDDKAQLKKWIDIARKLGGEPPKGFSKSMRFRLKPSDTLLTKWGKDKVLYCTPAKVPLTAGSFGTIDTARLKKIIAANTGDFGGWPDPVVIEYKEAEDMKLKLVGRNFLQFYFVWMKADHYKELWAEFGVSDSKLLHSFPAATDEKVYKDIDGTLKPTDKRETKELNGVPTEILSKTIGARDRKIQGRKTQDVMGTSATPIAVQLWGKDSTSSRIPSKKDIIKAEWLHRVAFSLSGPDVFKNLVFGSWECNTHMMLVEGIIAELTKWNKGDKFRGTLTTKNNTGDIARFGLSGTKKESVPGWAKNYSWLCFSLHYVYEMKGNDSPLGAIVNEIYFDPWSIYVPLSMEPRLDTMLIEDLKAGDATTAAVPHGKTAKPSLTLKAMVDHKSNTYPTLAWNAAVKGLPSLDLPDIVIKRPSIATPPTDQHDTSRFNHSILVGTPAPQGGFVLQGEVNVFGTSVVGNLEKWIGPAPDDVTVGIDPPSIERVTIPGDFHMSMLIPLLRDTPFDKITFRNVTIYHQNYAFDKTKSIGWHFNADWVIDSSCGLLHDILATVLQVNQPILSIHAGFGTQLRWNAPLSLHSFILEGVFSNLTISPVSGLTLTSIGVRLLGIRGFSYAPEPHSTLSFGFGIFGTMKLTVPGSIVPLNLDYEMRLVGKTVSLSAEISGSIWEDALGVTGLKLNDVVFGTTFSVNAPWKTFSFDVSATFSYGGSTAYLLGSYAAGGHFSFMAELDNFGTNEINDVFSTLFSDALTLPDIDLYIESAILTIASGQGLSIALNNVTVAGYTAASVEVDFSSSGASLSGALSKEPLKFGDVELRDALIKLSFWTIGQKKRADLMIGGTLSVDFLSLTVAAAVHLYPGEGGVEWTVVAELDMLNRPFAISDVVPAIKGTFVDFSLKKAAIIAASKDDPLISQAFPGYQVREGVQVFGVIDSIPALNSLLRTDVHGLVLSAAWSKASGFNLSVALPAESCIDLGNGIRTTPITLAIRTNPIEIAIMAGVKVPVKDSTPLDFSFVLAADEIGASASAQMDGWWVKPFGIDHLKVGPEVTLSIEIVYVQFLATGTPSGFGVSGGLMIGTIEAFMAVNISDNPERQLLYGDVKKLGMSDLVTFAGTLLQQDVPKIPDGLLKFEELKIYICPFGVVLGKTVYPQGFSFKADMVFFNKRANIECKIDKAQKSIDIVGGVDNFELGPLTVRGSKGPRATLECHVGVSKQQLSIDGVVIFLDIKAQTYVDVQFLPNPKFKFYMMVQFAHVFMYKLDAELIGSIHDKLSLSGADFSLYAELENDILEYIAQHIIEQFEAAKTVATHGLETAKAKVDEAEKTLEDAIAVAQGKVDEAQRTWESYERSVRSTTQPIIDKYLAEITRLQGKIDEARGTYDRAMRSAQGAVDKANRDRGAALEAAQRGVDDAQRSMDRGIDDAQRALDRAQNALDNAFGNARHAIDNAEREVNRIQDDIDGIKRTIRDYDRAPWYEFWKKAAIAGLWASVWTLEASKRVADGILDGARAVLQGADYVSKQAAVGTAREALKVARSTGEGALSLAKGSLRTADETSRFAVQQAEKTLAGVRYGSEYVAFQGANAALEEFKNANKAAYEAAMATINALMDSAEFIAFNTARAGLQVAKGSTQLLDAAKEALSLAEKASQFALSVFEDLVNFGAKAVNIKTIILSGTLRGILGVGGGSARPLSAVIKGYILGRWFDIRAEFDLKDPVTFITAIFKQLWDVISNPLGMTGGPGNESGSSPGGSGDSLYNIVHGKSSSSGGGYLPELDPGDDLYNIVHGHDNPGPFSSSSRSVDPGDDLFNIVHGHDTPRPLPSSSRSLVGRPLPEPDAGDDLYNIIHGSGNRGSLPSSSGNLSRVPDEMPKNAPFSPFSGMQAARSKFLQQRPDVHKMLVDESESTPIGIPRGPFSGALLVSSQTVARSAFVLMQEQKGISVFADLDHDGM